MNYKRFTILLFGLYLCVNSNAQISTNEKPVSFGLDAEKANESLKSVQTITMPALDMDKIRAEDKEDEEYLPQVQHLERKNKEVH